MTPDLVTDRLILRPLSFEDAAPTAKLMTPAIARWTGSWTGDETSEQIVDRIRRYQDTEKSGFSINRAATLKATGELVGWMGAKRLDEHPERGSLGYWIGERWFGQGYTREALRALVPYVFEALGLTVIEAAGPDGECRVAGRPAGPGHAPYGAAPGVRVGARGQRPVRLVRARPALALRPACDDDRARIRLQHKRRQLKRGENLAQAAKR